MKEGQLDHHDMQRSTFMKHKRWADFWSAVSIVLSIGLFTFVSYIMDETNASADARIGAYVLLATIILAVVVWQAVAIGIAKLELAMKSVGRRAA
jgi:protein-S-isoprenylcysteine O-methyltransferase Ste14